MGLSLWILRYPVRYNHTALLCGPHCSLVSETASHSPILTGSQRVGHIRLWGRGEEFVPLFVSGFHNEKWHS